MEPSEDKPVSTRVKYFGIGLLFLLVLGHLIPYVTGYRVPNWDLYKVMHVINYLQYPDLFTGDRLSRFLAKSHTTTAPLYYYGIAYPFSFVLSVKWVVLTIGGTICIGCGFFAGRNWESRWDVIRALLVVFFLLHLFLTPLEGNRRSFTAFFLLGLFWTETSNGYLKQLLLVGLAAGIYPPVALLCLAYLGLRESHAWIQDWTTFTPGLLKLLGVTTVFLLVLTPYWTSLLQEGPGSGVTDFVYSLEYNFDSPAALLETFLAGSRQALFRDTIHFDLFLALLGFTLVQGLVLTHRFRIRRRHGLLLVASLILWLVAHLTHPLIYQPFKYTRMSLLLVLLLPFLDNLPATVKRLRKEFSALPVVRWFGYALAGGCLVLWGFFVTNPGAFEALTSLPLVGQRFWKFLFVLPVFLVLSLAWPDRLSIIPHAGFVGLLVVGLVFLPHPDRDNKLENTALNNLEGLFQTLRNTPKGSIVAGPTGKLLDPVPTYGLRGVFVSGNISSLSLACDRTRKLVRVYFRDSRRKLVEFMYNNDIDYLLVDREMIQNRMLSGQRAECYKPVTFSRKPFLDQHFPDAVWTFKRQFYLLTPTTVQFHR